MTETDLSVRYCIQCGSSVSLITDVLVLHRIFKYDERIPHPSLAGYIDITSKLVIYRETFGFGIILENGVMYSSLFRQLLNGTYHSLDRKSNREINFIHPVCRARGALMSRSLYHVSGVV